MTGSFLSSTWSMSVKIAVLAPIPRASDRMATVEKRGLRRRPRRAKRRSGSSVVIPCFDGPNPGSVALTVVRFWSAASRRASDARRHHRATGMPYGTGDRRATPRAYSVVRIPRRETENHRARAAGRGTELFVEALARDRRPRTHLDGPLRVLARFAASSGGSGGRCARTA